MRPIFNPSARVSVACPSRVGCGVAAGCVRSGLPVRGFLVAVVRKVLTGLGSGLAMACAAAELASFGTVSLGEGRFGGWAGGGITSVETAAVDKAGRSSAGAGFSVFVDLAACQASVFDAPLPA